VRGWTGRLTFVALSTLALAATGASAAHADCPVLDVACQADEAIGAVEEVVGDTLEQVDTPVDDTIDPIVDDALNRVHDLLGDAPIDLPDPIDGGRGGGDGGHGGPPVGEGPPGTPTPADPGGPGTFGRRSPERAGIAGPSGPTISAASGIAPPRRADRTSGNPFAEALGGVARSLAIVLALFGLAVAFVAIQDRFDRTDPRLALAPIDSDVVEFA
jgi:hypothetical protein